MKVDKKKLYVELEAIRQWLAQDRTRTAALMLDTSDGDIWADVFLTANDWKEYHSQTVIHVCREMFQQGIWQQNFRAIRQWIEALPEGWVPDEKR